MLGLQTGASKPGLGKTLLQLPFWKEQTQGGVGDTPALTEVGSHSSPTPSGTPLKDSEKQSPRSGHKPIHGGSQWAEARWPEARGEEALEISV